MLIIIWYSCIQGIQAPLRSKVSETHEHSKTFTEQMCNIYLKKRGCVIILAHPLFVTCCKTYNKASTFPSGGFVMSKSFSNFVTIK
jgi:hypothetical protein